MKYVNKEACVQKGAVQNVIEEVELLREVDHPFVVSLWYTFQVTRISFNPYLEYVHIEIRVLMANHSYIILHLNFRTQKICSLFSNHYLEEISGAVYSITNIF